MHDFKYCVTSHLFGVGIGRVDIKVDHLWSLWGYQTTQITFSKIIMFETSHFQLILVSKSMANQLKAAYNSVSVAALKTVRIRLILGVLT